MALRVLVVEDSATVRGVICAVLVTDPTLEIVGVAVNGREAIEMCERLAPDVITMDMMMPVVDGLAATEHLMARRPTPILIVSASTNRGELFRTYDALAAGAVDVLEKPLGDEQPGDWERRLVAAVKMVAWIRVITHPRGWASAAPDDASRRSSTARAVPAPGAERHELIAVGASTGGPGVLADALGALPASCAVPVLFVLHIGEPFGVAFAEWLEARIGLRVAYATDGEHVASKAGEVVMAPPGHHLTVRHGRLRLDRGAERNSCRPSIDTLLESVAGEYGERAIGCILTGMGRDGAAGLLAMRRAGAVTVVQDEATSVVYGMPREAMLVGAAQHVLPLAQIGTALAVLAAGSRGATP